MNSGEVVRESIEGLSGRARQCAFHAYHHLDRASAVVHLDPEIAVFRAITAEEEAATAVFFALKQRRYDNARSLQYRSHVHKLALYPFIAQIRTYLGSLRPPLPEARLRKLEEKGGPRLVWEMKVPDGRWAQPMPPLHALIAHGETGKPYHFEREFKKLAGSAGDDEIREHLVAIANQRNRLLYASEKGRPVVSEAAATVTLGEQRHRVDVLCAITCMIAPYSERGVFAQQCLNAFLGLLGRIERETLQDLDYEMLPPPENVKPGQAVVDGVLWNVGDPDDESADPGEP